MRETTTVSPLCLKRLTSIDAPTCPLSAKRFTSRCKKNSHLPRRETAMKSATEAYKWKTVRHGRNCSRETIAKFAARMLKRHVDPHPLFRANKYHCCRGLQPDRRRPPEGDNRGRHASRRAAAAVAVHRHQISGHAAEHATDLQQLAAGSGGRKDWTVPHAIDAGDSRHDSLPLPWSSSPVGARCERCKDYRRPSDYGCRRRYAARAEAAASVSLGFTNRHHIRIFRRDSGRHRSDAGTACFHISAFKGTTRKRVHKGSISVSLPFLPLAGNSSDRQPPAQFALSFR